MFYLLDLERTISSGATFYWKANRQGYTPEILQAGLFNEIEASKIVINDLDNQTIMIPQQVVTKIIKNYY